MLVEIINKKFYLDRITIDTSGRKGWENYSLIYYVLIKDEKNKFILPVDVTKVFGYHSSYKCQPFTDKRFSEMSDSEYAEFWKDYSNHKNNFKDYIRSVYESRDNEILDFAKHTANDMIKSADFNGTIDEDTLKFYNELFEKLK